MSEWERERQREIGWEDPERVHKAEINDCL